MISIRHLIASLLLVAPTGCFTLGFVQKAREAKTVESVEITPEPFADGSVRLSWRARNRAGVWIGKAGVVEYRSPSGLCSAPWIGVEKPLYALKVVDAGSAVEIEPAYAPPEAVARASLARLRRISRGSWPPALSSQLDDPCFHLLVVGHRSEDEVAALALYERAIVLEEPVEDTSLSSDEIAFVPLAVLADVVTLPLQAPVWGIVLLLEYVTGGP